jgi:hypothetical protein
MGGGLPSFTNVSKIERRAQKIGDPVQRLRYLRRATATPPGRFAGRWIAPLALLTAVLPLGSDALNLNREPLHPRPTSVAPPQRIANLPADVPNVWPVEQTAEYDLYSNGLRIENRFAVANQPRSYRLIHRDSGERGPLRTQPAGIVFHTTESDQLPFASDQRSALKRVGHDVLLYIRNKRAYHFLIDRFGQVHRIVAESDSANHAGRSVWADADWLYLDLNTSFLGVAFEARMQSGEAPVSEAQLRAARALVEVLRAKYNLPAENCVTHAQVSVNAENMRIGYHTDWGSNFPFEEAGLPNNYSIPNPSLYLFGFEYDPAYQNSTGPDLWTGLALAEERVRKTAAERGMSLTEYRSLLQQKYRDAQSALHQRSAPEEN